MRQSDFKDGGERTRPPDEHLGPAQPQPSEDIARAVKFLRMTAGEIRSTVAGMKPERQDQYLEAAQAYDHAADRLTHLEGREARVHEAEQIIRDLIVTEGDPCDHFDHHGYCQSHDYFETDPPCANARAKAFLGLPSESPHVQDPAPSLEGQRGEWAARALIGIQVAVTAIEEGRFVDAIQELNFAALCLDDPAPSPATAEAGQEGARVHDLTIPEPVLHVLNLYGDETLHKALDDIGVPRNPATKDTGGAGA